MIVSFLIRSEVSKYFVAYLFTQILTQVHKIRLKNTNFSVTPYNCPNAAGIVNRRSYW